MKKSKNTEICLCCLSGNRCWGIHAAYHRGATSAWWRDSNANNRNDICDLFVVVVKRSMRHSSARAWWSTRSVCCWSLWPSPWSSSSLTPTTSASRCPRKKTFLSPTELLAASVSFCGTVGPRLIGGILSFGIYQYFIVLDPSCCNQAVKWTAYCLVSHWVTGVNVRVKTSPLPTEPLAASVSFCRIAGPQLIGGIYQYFYCVGPKLL